MRYFFIIVSFVFSCVSFAQLSEEEEGHIESLKREIEGDNHDTLKIKALQEWDNMIYFFDAELDLDLNFQIVKLCEKNLSQNQTEKELLFYQKRYGSSLNNIGIIYHDKGNYRNAIEFYTRALEIREKIDDRPGVASCLNNIGTLYDDIQDYSKALEYYERSLEIKRELNDSLGIASSLNNIGSNYSYQEEYDEALEYYEKSLEIRLELMDNHGIAQNYHNMGIAYMSKGQFEEAKDYNLWSYEIFLEEGDRYGMTLSLNNLGRVHKELGNYSLAEDYALQSLKLAEEEGLAAEIKESAKLLSQIYKKKGEYRNAFDMLERYVEMADSLVNDETTKAILEREFEYEISKDSIKNAEEQKILDAELTAEKAKNKQKEQLSYFLYGIIFLGLLFIGFIFNRFQITRKQKRIIEEQKKKVDEAFDELEWKNSEILSSISYAKRIQSAILPSDKLIEKTLPNSFIVYQPKDIVAGDFYWVKSVNTSASEYVLFAAADCTGHGVPGAMVSVVCHNALNRAVDEMGFKIPGEILDKVSEIVQEQFKESVHEVNDGMDIALCALDRSSNEIHFSGAHNPLWIVRDGKLIETSGNKQPIGKFDKRTNFTTHSIKLERNDLVYVFSDGIADQFGGEKRKKLKIDGLRKLLISTAQKPLNEQKAFIENRIQEWKGDVEQIDDICLIGVQIK